MQNTEPRGFSIEQEVTIDAPLERVWAAFTQNVDDWWRHRLLGDDSSVSLEPSIGGQFLERNGDSAVVWGNVTFLKPKELLVLNGALGMQRDAVASNYGFEFSEENGTTTMKFNHVVFGTQDEAMAGAHEAGWPMLWDCLKAYLDNGVKWRDAAE